MAARPTVHTTHAVATFGSDSASNIIGNHNYSYHNSFKDAQIQQLLDIIGLIKDGYTLIGQTEDGDAADIIYRLEKGAEVRLVGLWEE